ncbi:MAG: RIP metalloprotease RseP [Rhodospirillales bacterium]|nr:RIP metalloprotease RseP [Rhodospirillales bacterium]
MSLLHYVVPFILVLSVLVFVHELGHFWVARRCGVKVEVFSIGFGREIFGWTDRAGTRWKVSWLPLGGYVKMFGDADAASTPGPEVASMSPEERAKSFFHKPLPQRAAVVAAGPAANFLLAILLLAGMFAFVGQPFTPPQVGAVLPGSAAERAGIEAGDIIASIDGAQIERFEDIQRIVQLNLDRRMKMTVLRAGASVDLDVTPNVVEEKDRAGNVVRIARLGIRGQGMAFKKHNPAEAVWRAVEETWNQSAGTLKALGQMIAGSRGTEELGGPIRIAKMSGEVAQGGMGSILLFMAVLSINLGLINLFPIPMLDGGHLLLYAAEAVRGRPLPPKAVEYGFRIGFALVISLMVFATWNDLVQTGVVRFLVGLVS